MKKVQIGRLLMAAVAAITLSGPAVMAEDAFEISPLLEDLDLDDALPALEDDITPIPAESANDAPKSVVENRNALAPLPAVEADVEPVLVAQQPEADAAVDIPVVEADAPITEAAPEPAAEPAVEPVVEAPAVEAAPEPIVEAAPEPVVEPVVETPAVEVAPEPAPVAEAPAAVLPEEAPLVESEDIAPAPALEAVPVETSVVTEPAAAPAVAPAPAVVTAPAAPAAAPAATGVPCQQCYTYFEKPDRYPRRADFVPGTGMSGPVVRETPIRMGHARLGRPVIMGKHHHHGDPRLLPDTGYTVRSPRDFEEPNPRPLGP